MLIENCPSWFKFLCPRTWSQLARTPQLDVRQCDICGRKVYRCESAQEIEVHTRAGEPYAVATSGAGCSLPAPQGHPAS